MFVALISWFLRWWCFVCGVVYYYCSCSLFHIRARCFSFDFFRTKTRSETKNTSKPNTTNRNNEQEQRTTHQQQKQRTISNTKKETQVRGTKQKIKDTANHQNTFNVVLVFYIVCSIFVVTECVRRSDFLVLALMVFRLWRCLLLLFLFFVPYSCSLFFIWFF